MKPQHATALADLTECYREIEHATTEEEAAEAANMADMLRAYLLEAGIPDLPAPPIIEEPEPMTKPDTFTVDSPEGEARFTIGEGQFKKPVPQIEVTKHSPAYVLTKDGPQLLLPGQSPPTEQKKGGAEQTRMF